MISANSMLVIRNYKYNGSIYQFSSNVKVDSDLCDRIITINYELKHGTSITVNGTGIR